MDALRAPILLDFQGMPGGMNTKKWGKPHVLTTSPNVMMPPQPAIPCAGCFPALPGSVSPEA